VFGGLVCVLLKETAPRLRAATETGASI
jgi:hypothetical protein